MSAPANQQQPYVSSPIAGTVLPIKRAEELLATLPGVIAARIVASESGAVDEIHVLTTSEVTPKQTVRNVESALIAHLAMRVDHRKISVATTIETPKVREAREAADAAPAARPPQEVPQAVPQAVPQRAPQAVPQPSPARAEAAVVTAPSVESSRSAGAVRRSPSAAAGVGGAVVETDVFESEAGRAGPSRHLLFENVEVRRSRRAGVAFRVTLRKGAESFVGESGGFENERSRIEHVARATVEAIKEAEGDDRHLVLEGCKAIEAFDRQFAFVALSVREGREAALLTGSCEIKEGPETAAVLAVLDATNRWIARPE